MAHAISPFPTHNPRRLIAAFALAFALVAFPLAASPAPAIGGTQSPAAADQNEKNGAAGGMDVEELKQRLRVLGEALRNAIEDATRSLSRGEDGLSQGRGGLGALAPSMRGRDLRAVYGPKGPTVRSVRALLDYRLVLLGNDRLTAGRVYERDKRIIAEVVTAREKALVTRYMINKTTGVWVPER